MSLSINLLANAIKDNKSLISDADTTIKTDAVQAYINTKQDSVTGAITSILTQNLTESKCLISDNSGKIAVSAVSSTDIANLSGCSSNIQTQLDDKINTADVTGAIMTINNSNLTASKILISNNSGKIDTSYIEESKLQHLANVSTNIQSNLDSLDNKYIELNKLSLNSSGTLASWTAPSVISSITSLSSLPGTYIFVKNKQTRQRITLTSSTQLHSNRINKMIYSLKITVDGTTSNLNLGNSGIVIDILNKTIDFDYTVTSLSQHDIELKLREASIVSIGNVITSAYTISVLASDIFEFPTLGTTSKNSPHNTADITLNETLSITSTFSTSLHPNIIPSITITADDTNPSVTSSMSGANLNYSFIVEKDADHTGDITLSLGNLSHNYSWSAAGFLTAVNDIYTFPNTISYDGSNNGLTPYHVRAKNFNELLLTFTGGDKLHSDNYSSQINKIEYLNDGVLKLVDQTDISINSINETILLTNILPDAVGNIDFTVILIAPDGAQQTLTFTIVSSDVLIGQDSRVRTGVSWEGWHDVTTSFNSDSSDIWGYWYHYNTAHYGRSGVAVQNPLNDWRDEEGGCAYASLGHYGSLTLFEVYGNSSVTATANVAVGYTASPPLGLGFYSVTGPDVMFTLPGDNPNVALNNATWIGRLHDTGDSITLNAGYYVSYFEWGNRNIFVHLTYTNWPTERNIIIDEV